MEKQQNEDFDDKEAAKRRDEALKRALGMPHKPHKNGNEKKTGGSRRQSDKK